MLAIITRRIRPFFAFIIATTFLKDLTNTGNHLADAVLYHITPGDVPIYSYDFLRCANILLQYFADLLAKSYMNLQEFK